MNDPYNIRFRLIPILASCEWVTFAELREMYIAKHQTIVVTHVQMWMICDAVYALQHFGLVEIDERASTDSEEHDLVRGLLVSRETVS